jgi:hypothetical protein
MSMINKIKVKIDKRKTEEDTKFKNARKEWDSENINTVIG